MKPTFDTTLAQHFLHEALVIAAGGGEVPEILLENLLAEVQKVVDLSASLSDEAREGLRVQLLDLEQGQAELVHMLRMQRERLAEELMTIEGLRQAEQSYQASLSLAYQGI